MSETPAAAYSGFIGSYLDPHILIVLLAAGGIYFTVRTKFVRFRFLSQGGAPAGALPLLCSCSAAMKLHLHFTPLCRTDLHCFVTLVLV